MTSNVPTVHDVAVAALLGGSFGWLRIPAGGKIEVARREAADCYRLTIDLTAGWPLDPTKAREYNVESLRRLEVIAARELAAAGELKATGAP